MNDYYPKNVYVIKAIAYLISFFEMTNPYFLVFFLNKLKLQTFTILNIGFNNYLFEAQIGYGFVKIINVLFFLTRDRRFTAKPIGYTFIILSYFL